MSLFDFFRPSYRLSQGCPGCAARMAHIEDLQNLIRSEREGNAILQGILLQKSGMQPQVMPQSQEEMKPLRQFRTASQLRHQAEQREREAHPNARTDYWTRIQAEYDKAGKLPKEEIAPPVVETQENA
jgi:hypothetical protein